MVAIIILLAVILSIALYSFFWVKHSVNPSDYPWLEAYKKTTQNNRNEWLTEQTDTLIKQMSLKEKIHQLSGDGGILFLVRLGVNVMLLGRFCNTYSGKNKRLNIPPFSFTDGPRGIVIGKATGFPVAIARAASWDVDLERKVADALGKEARASGANYFAGLCINLLRHPAWGRAQECYGEDSYLTGEFAVALSQGVQQHNVMVCTKHFAVNNIENSRFYVDVKVDRRTLHEMYLPHFKKCIDAGVASVMSSYNKLNGEYCGHNKYLLDDVLRKQWGFKGFVSSDWLWGIYNHKEPVIAGMDVEMPYGRFYGSRLYKSVKNKKIDEMLIDRNVHRVIKTKLDFISREDKQKYDSSLLACQEHQALAQYVAEQSMVLLKNNTINNKTLLPLQANEIKIIAVIGSLAKKNNLGDHGSSRTSPPSVCTLFNGLESYIRKHASHIKIIFNDGEDEDTLVKLCQMADKILIVAGYQHSDEGENLTSNHKAPSTGAKQKVAMGGDRDCLSLPQKQITLINTITQINRNCIVTIIAGSAVVTSEWDNSVQSILMAWYPGMAGGHAWARLLMGDISPSGKLPFSIPKKEDDLVAFDAFEETSHYNYLHGYMHLEKKHCPAQYAFGFGLTYSSFHLSNLSLSFDEKKDTIQICIDIKNTGYCASAEVTQLYIDFSAIEKSNTIMRPTKLLKGFKKVFLQPQQKKTVSFTVNKNELLRFDAIKEQWFFDQGQYTFKVGNSSNESDLLADSLNL